ncbi:MAG: HDOD domain-containing protein [Planctomycetota bacterium]
MPSTQPIAIEELLRRTDALPSPPAVALELIRLADHPQADGAAVCAVLERDPAIAAKLLRVVNAAAGGRLAGEVASLPQAVAMAGIEPLKLIVLGFTLAEGFADGAGADRLATYWRRTLATAAAAGEVARLAWPNRPAATDEAFAAGLLQGIGSLVLLGVAPDEYGRVLDTHAKLPPGPDRPTLAEAERRGLGFSHTRLSASLLAHWGLPKRLVAAIERQDAIDWPADPGVPDEAERVARSLWVANGLVALLVDRELAALAALTDDAARLAELQPPDINGLVERLGPRIESLAAAMEVEAPGEHDFRQTLLDAHARLAIVGEFTAQRLIRDALPTDAAITLLAETEALAAAVRGFLEPALPPERLVAEPAEPTTARRPHAPLLPRRDTPESLAAARTDLLDRLGGRLIDARIVGRGVTLALLDVAVEEGATGRWAKSPSETVRGWARSRDFADEIKRCAWVRLGRTSLAAITPIGDRADASRIWWCVARGAFDDTPATLSVGLATVAVPSVRFDGERMIEAAELCLDAASRVTGPAVKGIEVF